MRYCSGRSIRNSPGLQKGCSARHPVGYCPRFLISFINSPQLQHSSTFLISVIEISYSTSYNLFVEFSDLALLLIFFI